MAKEKKIPNPFGRKGCEAHQQKIAEVMDKMEKKGLIAKDEVRIDCENGQKRYAAGTNLEGELVEIVQVGVTTKNGKPVSREQKAIDEIEQATGIEVTFISYKTL